MGGSSKAGKRHHDFGKREERKRKKTPQSRNPRIGVGDNEESTYESVNMGAMMGSGQNSSKHQIDMVARKKQLRRELFSNDVAQGQPPFQCVVLQNHQEDTSNTT